MAEYVLTPMTQIPMKQRRWMPVTIVLGTAAAYALAFAPLYQVAGDVVVAFTVIPVAAARWLLGPRIALFAGLFWIPLNIINFTLVGRSDGRWCSEGGRPFS